MATNMAATHIARLFQLANPGLVVSKSNFAGTMNMILVIINSPIVYILITLLQNYKINSSASKVHVYRAFYPISYDAIDGS